MIVILGIPGRFGCGLGAAAAASTANNLTTEEEEAIVRLASSGSSSVSPFEPTCYQPLAWLRLLDLRMGRRYVWAFAGGAPSPPFILAYRRPGRRRLD